MKNLLRTTALLLIFNSSFLITKAQWVSIPDSNFGTWLNTNGYVTCLQGNSTVGWQMDTTCNAVISATQVICSNKPIKDLTGIQYFDSLRVLYCVNDSLNTIPPLPNLLGRLVCGNNQLSSLPVLPDSLTFLSCTYNQLTTLPPLPDSLTYLSCTSNQLTTLPPLPDMLVSLYCDHNQLVTLPVLSQSLSYLDCSANLLNTLPTLPNSLTTIKCGNNQLNSLPTLPNLLGYLFCGGNLIGYLPALSDSLTFLNCSNNQLTALPTLPNALVQLYCGKNQITALSVLPRSLNILECQFNQLTTLPPLPDSLGDLSCYNNPNLFCLPRLNKVRDLFYYSTSITCLPNYPESNAYSYPALSAVPLCDVFNANGCGTYWNISGEIYEDANSNCVHDITESFSGNFKVMLYQNSNLVQQMNAGVTGHYSFSTDTGQYTYSIDTANLPFYIACPDTGYYTSFIVPTDSTDAYRDFGLHCNPGFDLAAQSIEGWSFRPASFRWVDISVGDLSNFYGAHCAAGTSGSVQLIINGAAHYSSAASGALTPTSVVNDTITWSIADFGAVNFFQDFDINVATDFNAQLGSQICFTLIVNPIAGDNNPTNNILTHCFTVVGSFDPNEKEVYPAGNIDTATHWLTYTIHFQNTGTAEAQHIYVTDTLDSNIDAGSFQLLAYSHQPMVQLKGNNLRFNFPNINLPDSNTNEPLSHGYVQYKVKLKDNLPLGTNINNTAFIYFDFNSPVVTNTTSNTIALATGVANLGLRNADFGLNPNPATESVRISIDESMIGSSMSITDMTGRRVAAVQLSIISQQISIANLAKGVYIITVEGQKGRVTKKLVKQ